MIICEAAIVNDINVVYYKYKSEKDRVKVDYEKISF